MGFFQKNMSQLNPWKRLYTPSKAVGKKLSDIQSTSDLPAGLLQQKLSQMLMPQSLLGSRLHYLRRQMGLSAEEFRAGIDKILKDTRCGDLLNTSAIYKICNGERELSFLEGLAISIILDVSVWAIAPTGLAELRSKRRKSTDFWVVHAVVGSTIVFRHLVFKEKIFTLSSDPSLNIPDVVRPTLEAVLEANPGIAVDNWANSLEIGRYGGILR